MARIPVLHRNLQVPVFEIFGEGPMPLERESREVVCVSEIINFLDEFAPPALAEEWDNVGLLVGDRSSEASAIMTCLTLTPNVAAEAVRRKPGIIITHHPILFRPVQSLTSETTEGRMLLDLIRAGIAVYSPHTGYDSAKEGINQQLAEMF